MVGRMEASSFRFVSSLFIHSQVRQWIQFVNRKRDLQTRQKFREPDVKVHKRGWLACGMEHIKYYRLTRLCPRLRAVNHCTITALFPKPANTGVTIFRVSLPYLQSH